MLGIDLFAGAGGMTLGAKLANIDVRFAVEKHHAAAQTYRLNHPEVCLFQEDIKKVRFCKEKLTDEEFIVFGGPPCQGFSTSNQRSRNTINSSNWLVAEFIRIVEELGPQWVLFENVAGILQTDGGSFVIFLRETLRNLGYNLIDGVLNSVDFGAPQKRNRFFVLGSRDSVSPSLPTGSVTSRVTVADAIGDLPALRNGADTDLMPYEHPAPSSYAGGLRQNLSECTGNLVSRNAENIVSRYSFIPQGGNWRDVPGMTREGRDDRRRYHSGIYHRLVDDQPSIVIGNFRKNMLIHPTQDRGLSVREAARLQSFPDIYKFAGSIGLQQQQVGNAVPPLLAAAVFRDVLRQNFMGADRRVGHNTNGSTSRTEIAELGILAQHKVSRAKRGLLESICTD